MSEQPITFELSDEAVERIAARAPELLAECPAPAPEPWLTVPQAAEHLGISTSQLYTLISQRRNGLPVVAEGSRRYFKASELDEWRRGEHTGNGPVSDIRIGRL